MKISNTSSSSLDYVEKEFKILTKQHCSPQSKCDKFLELATRVQSSSYRFLCWNLVKSLSSLFLRIQIETRNRSYSIVKGWKEIRK